MANSATNLDLIATSQAQKEVVANGFFDAASPATLFGRRWNGTNGLTWAYYGGNVNVNGVPTAIANGVVALTASLTNYIEANAAGVVDVNTTGFTPGNTPLYTVVVGSMTATSYTDMRLSAPASTGKSEITAPASGDYTMTAADFACQILEVGGTPGAAFNVIAPAAVAQWSVFNNTAQAMTIKTSAGTGPTVAAGKRCVVYCDSTNVQRVSADT